MPLVSTSPFNVDTTCIEPTIMITGGGQWNHGNGAKWCGPFNFSYGAGNGSASIASDGDGNRWIDWHSNVSTEDARTLVSGDNLQFFQLPTLPGSEGVRMGAYDKSLDSWLVMQNGNVDNSTDYGATWNAQTFTSGVGGGSGQLCAATTTGGTTTIYHVSGQSCFTTTDAGASFTSQIFGLPTFSARSLAYDPFRDVMWVSISNGGVYSADRVNFTAGSGSWTIRHGSGSGSNPLVDVDVNTGAVIITYNSGGNWVSKRALYTGSPVNYTFGGTQTILVTGASNGSLCHDPVSGRTYAAAGSNVYYTDDNASTWQLDPNLTVPTTSGTLRIQNKDRFTYHDI